MINAMYSALPIRAVGLKMNHWMCFTQVTTARKAVTLLLSYIIFTKPLLGQHCTGLILITMGITLKMLPDSCQNRINMATQKYSPLQTEASTSRSDPTNAISRLEEGEAGHKIASQ